MNHEPEPRVTAGEGRIGKQIMLPWSKAVEIAAKSVQVRFWRSMITMSSIVLAIAFLTSIWASTAVVAALGVRPQRHLARAKANVERVRAALAGTGGVTREAVLQEFAGDLADAIAQVEDAIEDNEEAIEDAYTKAEKQKLADENRELAASIVPANHLKLLEEYLVEERRRIAVRKGELDTALQQERAGEAATPDEDAAPDEDAGTAAAERPATAARPAQAAAGGGFFTDFIRQMSATDKWLAILALLVCFVGIVNAMFMTVQERFREIGTMKCLGALDAFIVKIFLVESAALGLIGTLAGVLVGTLLSLVRQWLVYGVSVFVYFPWGNLLSAAVLASLIGLLLSILAAIFPARRAARMEPVEAMRVEE